MNKNIYNTKKKYIERKEIINLIGGKKDPIIIFFSGNKNKVREVENAFKEYNENNGTDFHCLSVDIDVEEIQSVSVKNVIKEKVKDSFKELIDKKNDLYLQNLSGDKSYVLRDIDQKEIILICEDTGMGIEMLGSYKGDWFPGALIKFYYGSQKEKYGNMHEANKAIVENYKGSDAIVETCFGLFSDGINEQYCDNIRGTIPSSYNSDGKGFDFDFFVIPNGETKQLHNY